VNELIPTFAAPENRVLTTLVGSDAGGDWVVNGLLFTGYDPHVP